MKQLLSIAILALTLGACQDKAGERTYNAQETTNRPPSSDPNDFGDHTLDTSTGAAPDSSTVLSYDTSARRK